MSVYMIVEAKEVIDKQKYSEYISKVPEIVKKFGGKYIVRGGKAEVIAGDWNPARLIIVEFGSMDKFQAWWNSPDYRKVAPLREQGAKTNAVIIEGV